MAIQSMQLDPDAQAYTDDEIVGKVNAAAADITRAGSVDADALFDGTTNKAYTGTEKTKLEGVEEDAKDDQDGLEMVTALEALDPGDKLEADAIIDGTTNKVYSDTEKTKLAGVEGGAEVNPADLAALDSAQDTKLNGIEEGADVNPTDDEIVTGINNASNAITREAALSQDDLKIIKTNPLTGEFQIKNIHREAGGKLDVEYDDVAES